MRGDGGVSKIALEDVGVRAVVQGIGPYERNAKKVQKAQQRMGDSAVKAAKQSGFLSKALGQVAATAGGFLVAQGVMAIPRILGGILSTSRDLELQMKKANIVFGDQIDVVNEWAKANAKAMGITASSATNLAARFGDILIPMGFARDTAAEMSTEVVGLAGALAEWSGGQRSAAEVADILAKAMTGEREALKGLGVVITEADVTAKLAARGFVDLAGAQLQQARATVTQELIFEKSTDAQAAYADGAGTAARKQAELSAEMAEAKEVLAQALTPALLAVTGAVTQFLVPGLQAAAQGMGKFISASGTVAKVLKENKDLIAAFAAVSLAAVLIPAVTSAVTALWNLHAVFRAIAVARHISIFQAVIASLALPTIGLPMLAIGAAAAGLAIFGLTRHFMRGKDAADRFKDAQAALGEEMAEVDRIARLTGVDEGEARLRHLAEAFFENERGLADLGKELGDAIIAMQLASQESGVLSGATWDQIMAAKELEGQYKDLEVAQRANVEEGKGLSANLADLVTLAAELGVPLAELIPLFPELTDAAAELSVPLGELDESVPAVTQKLDDQTKAVKALADALEDKLAAALRSLVTPTTAEEANLRATISGLEAKQSAIRALAALYDRELTPAEEAQVEVLDDEIDRFGTLLTGIEDAKKAEGDRVFALAGHFPTYREANDLAGGLALMLSDVATQGGHAQEQMATVAEKIDALADAGTPLNDFLRNTLIPTFMDTASSAIDMWIALGRGVAAPPGITIPNPPAGSLAPGFQSGGIVPGPIGQPMLALVHGGERITPAASAGGGQPISVVVSAPISMQDQMDWPSVRRAVHQEVDMALDDARSQALRSGAPLRSEIG